MTSEQEQPLTREAVLKLIEEHDGPDGLDLSDKNLVRIDLSELELNGVILDRANLTGANLRNSKLRRASLRKTTLHGANLAMASLDYANMQEADLGFSRMTAASLVGAQLQKTHLRGADLNLAMLAEANLEEAVLAGAKLEYADLHHATLSNAFVHGSDLSSTKGLAHIKWGRRYTIGEESRGHFDLAAEEYRNLKMCYNQSGIYDIAGRFYYRETEAIRKGLRWRKKPWSKLRYSAFWLLCGYAEIPLRVVFWAAVVVFGIALGIYAASTLTFPSSLYYSAVSFTALGYGLGVSTTDSWVKGLGAIESFIGVSLIALFLVTFVRKMAR